MRFRLSLLLSTLFLAGCMSSETEKAEQAPSALPPAALQAGAASPTDANAAPAPASVASQGTPSADHPLPLGAPPLDNSGQQVFNCRTVGNATMCDVAGDPNADNTRHTN